MKKTVLILATVLIGQNVFAQIALDDTTLTKRNIQVALVSPLGTNGSHSLECTNRFSFNLIAGAAGGLNGFEFGGVANIETQYARGLQIAGATNVVKGDATGMQIAGFINVVKGHSGTQLAGFANIVGDSVHGVQMGGFTNISGGDLNGTQISGFINCAKGNVDGLQLAGFANIAGGNVKGAQMGGFINTAKHVKGVQIGVFNFCDSLDGVAIGILSFVRHGYQSIELGANETFHNELKFKTGNRRFYNILSAGVIWAPENPIWSLGYGLGRQIEINNRMALDLDLVSHWIVRNDWDRSESVNKISLSASYQIAKNFSVYGGATFNVVVDNGSNNEEDIAPCSMYNYTTNNGTSVTMYPGFRFGIKL